MHPFVFTFGAAHLFASCYLIIEAQNEAQAREYMFTKFGSNFAFCYNREQWLKEYIDTGLYRNLTYLGMFNANA